MDKTSQEIKSRRSSNTTNLSCPARDCRRSMMSSASEANKVMKPSASHRRLSQSVQDYSAIWSRVFRFYTNTILPHKVGFTETNL